MSSNKILLSCGTIVLGAAASAWASSGTYHVGPGQTYATIQDAVNAAAATDASTGTDYDGLVGGVAGGAPLPSSVQIIVHAGTYNENVIVPADPLGQKFQTSNDNWTIKAAPGDNVVLNGGITVNQGRDSGFVDGINIFQTGMNKWAFDFGTGGNTMRNWHISNGLIYGDGSAGGHYGYLMYGQNFFDHMTIYNMRYGASSNYASTLVLTNSIVAFCAENGLAGGNAYSYTDLFANNPNDSGGTDNGNNISSDPQFYSTDPSSPYFLWLQPGSLAAISGQGGTYMGARPVFVSSPEWNLNGSGDWSNAANWTGGVPNAVGASAKFGGIINAAATVTVDVPITVGKIEFNNSNAYTIAGSNALTINDAGGGTIQVTAGSHSISAPMTLVANTQINVAQAADTLTVSSDVTATGVTISKQGAGKLVMKNVRADGLNVTAGTVAVAPSGTPNAAAATSVVKALSIAGGNLDLSNNSMVIDYSGAVGTLVDDVRQHLTSGRLTSSSADATKNLGYADNAALGLSSFAGQTVDSSSVLVKYTYLGDTNLDGQVDVIDLGNLATAWQTNGVWANGDSNYDGFVDVIDLGQLATNWQAGVGSPLGPGSLDQALAAYGLPSVVVPEPASLGLIGCGLLAAARRRRQYRA